MKRRGKQVLTLAALSIDGLPFSIERALEAHSCCRSPRRPPPCGRCSWRGAGETPELLIQQRAIQRWITVINKMTATLQVGFALEHIRIKRRFVAQLNR